VSASAIVAIVAAAVAGGAAVAAFLVLRGARSHSRTLAQEIERGKAAFDEVIAREVEQRAADLERTLSIARAQSLSALADEERRIADERRRDVTERERDATTRLSDTLHGTQRGVEQRLAEWSIDLERLQMSLAEELQRIDQRQQLLTKAVETRIEEEADRLAAAIDEHRAAIIRGRDELNRWAQEVAKASTAELEQHAAERRRALNEVAERLRRRERELVEQIDHEQAEATQRVAAQLGDVERRQLEQLRRVVSRESTRYAEAAATQFETTIRSAREEAARRLGRELDIAVERFAHQAEGVLAERIEHLTRGALDRIEAQLVELRESERAGLEARLRELARRVDELGTRA
jgi:hypothetical protein